MTASRTPFSPEQVDALVGTLVDQINRGLRFDEIFANLHAHIGEAVPCHRVAVALAGAAAGMSLKTIPDGGRPVPRFERIDD